MANKSINAWLSMKNSLQSRLAELKEMRTQSATRQHTRYDGKEDIIEPMYDVKQVDKKCSQITTALFKIDQAVKEANASTKVEIPIDYDDLVKPIE